MCTVTYLPHRDGFILTHNRDEAPSRSPAHISSAPAPGGRLLFPRDTKAGGTWIAAAGDGRTACLLNGAFVKHKHLPPYRRSRGLLLLDFFDWSDPDAFFADYPLGQIEPFTFLLFQPGRVAEFRWDGTQRHLTNLPFRQPHFWCSATLYPAPMQTRRELLFRDWLQTHPPEELSPDIAPDILNLHQTGSIGDPENDYVMNREGRVRTVSITQIIRRKDALEMTYADLLDGHRDRQRLSLLTPSGDIGSR